MLRIEMLLGYATKRVTSLPEAPRRKFKKPPNVDPPDDESLLSLFRSLYGSFPAFRLSYGFGYGALGALGALGTVGYAWPLLGGLGCGALGRYWLPPYGS